MAEQWKAVPDYEGIYEVSDQGRVRSLNRLDNLGRKWRGRPMKRIRRDDGYVSATLWKHGVQASHLVHRLVLTTFVGPCPDGHESRHLDGDKANNHLTNLQWGTPSQNNYDLVAHGTHFNASKTHCPSGHPYDEENTYVHPHGRHRICITCRDSHNRRYRSMRKAAV